MKKGRILFASLSGSVIEWYDFNLYGTATGLVFSTLFFPSQDPSIAILLSFATFGVGYAARPVGSIIFGHYGDKIGRKKSGAHVNTYWYGWKFFSYWSTSLL